MITDYSWDIESWINRRLHKKRRTVKHIAWLNALLSPLQTIANEFSSKCQEWDFRIKYSSQQKVLASLLNKIFDPSLARIRVVTITDLMPPVILYDDIENPDHPIVYDEDEGIQGPILYDEDEMDSAYDFKVIVPASLSGSENRIRAWVERYRIGSKNYTIIYE